MTGLRKSRQIAKGLIFVIFGWEITATLVGLTVVLFVTVRGGAPTPERLIEVVGTLVLYGVLIWAIRDARKRRRPPVRVAKAEEGA